MTLLSNKVTDPEQVCKHYDLHYCFWAGGCHIYWSQWICITTRQIVFSEEGQKLQTLYFTYDKVFLRVHSHCVKWPAFSALDQPNSLQVYREDQGFLFAPFTPQYCIHVCIQSACILTQHTWTHVNATQLKVKIWGKIKLLGFWRFQWPVMLQQLIWKYMLVNITVQHNAELCIWKCPLNSRKFLMRCSEVLCTVWCERTLTLSRLSLLKKGSFSVTTHVF